MKLSAYQKQKQKIASMQKEIDVLKADLRLVVLNEDGGLTKAKWRAVFRMRDSVERALWVGSTQLTEVVFNIKSVIGQLNIKTPHGH